MAILRDERHERVGRRIENRALGTVACALTKKRDKLIGGTRMRRHSVYAELRSEAEFIALMVEPEHCEPGSTKRPDDGETSVEQPEDEAGHHLAHSLPHELLTYGRPLPTPEACGG
jgi:hypothetical protein